MVILLGLVGLAIGALAGGFPLAILFCVAGGFFGAWINRTDDQQAQGDRNRPLHDFEALRREVISLRSRVKRLEVGLSVAPETDTTPAASAALVPASPSSSPSPASTTQSVTQPVAEPAPQPMPAAAPKTAAAHVAAAPAAALVEPSVIARVAATQAPPEPRPEPKPQISPLPAEPSLMSRLFSGNIVAKVGVVVLFFGVGFLLKFAYDLGLMPPAIRLAAVAVAAAVLFGLGWRLRESRRLYGLILQGGASGLAYLDVFFALKTYGFIGPALGFGLFALLGVATTVVAVRQDSRTLAVLGLGGAFLAPVLASTGSGNHVFMFSYYLLLNIFILGVSWFRAWRELNLTGWLFTFVIGLIWGKWNYRPELFNSVEPFVLAFFAIYLIIPVLFATRQPPQLKGLVDGTLVFGTPAAVAVMQAGLVHGIPYGLAWSAAVGGVLYALLALLTWKRDSMRLLAESYAALAVGLGTMAIFFAFDAYPTFALWTIEGTAILWVGLRQNRQLARAFGMFVQLAAAMLFFAQYPHLARSHPVFNDFVYGCLMIAVASFISSRLLLSYTRRLDDLEVFFGHAILLWGALWWSVGGLDALHRSLEPSAMPNAVALFFMASFLAAELIGQWLKWGSLRKLAGWHPLVLAAVLGWQVIIDQNLLACLGALAWPLGFAVAFWTLRRQQRDGVAIAGMVRYLGLWTIMALAATREQFWLLDRGEYLFGMLLATAGYLTAFLRFHLRERGKPEASQTSGLVLIWAMGFWFGHAFCWAYEEWAVPLQIAAMLGLFAGSALIYEIAGSLLDWRALRAAASILWPAMAAALLAQLVTAGHPFESWAWLAWPAAFAVAYLTLYRQDRDNITLLSMPMHALCLWLAVAVAGLELAWWMGEWNFGTAWQASVLGFCPALALAATVFWGDRGRWPVAPNRDAYRDLVLGPVGGFVMLWVIYANLKSPGTMAPGVYLPLLNPIDCTVALSLFALWRWSRWFTGEEGSMSQDLRYAAAVLGFFWLNGIALRSIHFWAGVPYRFDALIASVLVQTTLSLLWASTALVSMFLARRRMERGLWVAGAVLLAAVVAKLFLIDLANSGTVERIVSFIGVGVLLLVIGYLAPVPPGKKAEPESSRG